MSWPAGAPAYTLPFGDYDDEDDQEGDTPPPGGSGTAKEKSVRRRSSKGASICCGILSANRKSKPAINAEKANASVSARAPVSPVAVVSCSERVRHPSCIYFSQC